MQNLNYKQEAQAFKESISDLKKVLTQKNINNNHLQSRNNNLSIEKNKSSLILEDDDRSYNDINNSYFNYDKENNNHNETSFNLKNYEKSGQTKSRSPNKFNGNGVNLNSLQIELD